LSGITILNTIVYTECRIATYTNELKNTNTTAMAQIHCIDGMNDAPTLAAI
jgi:hypothetical protein